MLYSTLVLLLLTLISFAAGELIHYRTCTDSVDSCSIGDVRVMPCPQALNNAPCRVRRRKSTKMSFDYTPHFDAEHLNATLTWVKSDSEELPLITLDNDGCKYTDCPVKSGEQRTYAINVPIEPKFPISPYTIRWALKDAVSGKRCCFEFDINVVR